MPTSFLKSMILTFMIVLQLVIMDIVLRYIQKASLSIDYFVLAGTLLIFISIAIYHMWINRAVEH